MATLPIKRHIYKPYLSAVRSEVKVYNTFRSNPELADKTDEHLKEMAREMTMVGIAMGKEMRQKNFERDYPLEKAEDNSNDQ